MSFESFAYLNLGYRDYKELGPGEIVVFDADGVKVLSAPGDKMKICTFLWVYYGIRLPLTRGSVLKRCGITAAGFSPDGTMPSRISLQAFPFRVQRIAVGYANESGIRSPVRYQVYAYLAPFPSCRPIRASVT